MNTTTALETAHEAEALLIRIIAADSDGEKDDDALDELYDDFNAASPEAQLAISGDNRTPEHWLAKLLLVRGHTETVVKNSALGWHVLRSSSWQLTGAAERDLYKLLRQYRYEELAEWVGDSTVREWQNGIHLLTGTRWSPEGSDKDGFQESGFSSEGIDRNGLFADGSIAPIPARADDLARRTVDESVQLAILAADQPQCIQALSENPYLSPEVIDSILDKASTLTDDADTVRLIRSLAFRARLPKAAANRVFECYREIPRAEFLMLHDPQVNVRVLSILHKARLDLGVKRKVNRTLREAGWIK